MPEATITELEKDLGEILEILKGQEKINEKLVKQIQQNENMTKEIAEYCKRLMTYDAVKSKFLSGLTSGVKSLTERIRALEQSSQNQPTPD